MNIKNLVILVLALFSIHVETKPVHDHIMPSDLAIVQLQDYRWKYSTTWTKLIIESYIKHRYVNY